MKNTKFNPYEVLELSKNCTEKDIQKAYKVQCLKWHPDKNRNNEEEAQRKFILAKEAFEFLYDKQKRSEYDRGVEAVRVRDERQRERMDKADDKRRKYIQELKEREDRAAQNEKRRKQMDPSQLNTMRRQNEKKIKEDFEDLAQRLLREVEEEMHRKNAVVNSSRSVNETAAKDNASSTSTSTVEGKTGQPGHDFSTMSFDDLFNNFNSKIDDAPAEKKRRLS